MSHPTLPDVNDLAHELNGSCASLNAVLKSYGVKLDDVPVAYLETLDQLVMQCDLCGWWDESGVFNDDQVCNDCEDQGG